MTIENIIRQRGIKEILHFTTNCGVTGMLVEGVVKPRKRLLKDKHLEHIIIFNCPDRRRDIEWHDYNHLSITSVNRYLFGIAEGKWHAGMDGWWCILSFLPEILTHPGVIFTTTNNIYTSVIRDEGPDGLERLFRDVIVRWSGSVVTRSSSTPDNQPTDPQAEVLYPGELSLDYLECIYIEDPNHASHIESLFGIFPKPPALRSCEVRPDLFE